MVPASYRNSIYTKFSKLLAQALRMEKTILCFLRPLFTRSKWNMSENLGFPTGRDSATFRDSGTAKTFLSRDKGTTGQKFLHCPGTKGQRDKLKILPRDGTGRDSQNLGRDGPGQPKSGTGRGTKRDRAEKDVLKQYKDVLKQKRMF